MAASAASSTQDKDPDSGLESTASVSSLSSSVNEQVEEPEVKRKKLLLFDDFTDGTLLFSDGGTLKVNIGVLSFKSKVFHAMFKETSPPDHVVEIKDCDLQLFKMFLNCMLGLEDCTFDKAFALLPIACKYQTSKLIQKCVKVLIPTEKDVKVVRTLNLAVSCKCAELEEAVIQFLVNTRFIYYLLSLKESFYMFLEPGSMLKLLQRIKIDSYIVRLLFVWGRDYLLKNDDHDTDLKSFLAKTNISDFITVSSFKSNQDLIDFDESEIGAGYFDRSEIYSFIKVNKEPCKNVRVAWFYVKAGDVLVEKILIKDAVFISNHVMQVTVTLHPVTCYEFSERPDGKLYEVLYTGKLSKSDQVFTRSSGQKNKNIDFTNYTSLWCIDFDLNMNVVSDLEIEIKRTFHVDCRVLKGSPENFEMYENVDDLYLTKSIKFKHLKKAQ